MSEVAAAPTPTIGFIGLGRMGSPMARLLAEGGHRVLGYDLSPEALAQLAGAGGTAVRSAGEAAAADVVVLMLPDSTVVTAVLRDDAVVSALTPGRIVIDMSSSEPVRTRQLAAELAQRGVHLVDAPVSGGVRGAQTGKLTIMVGGDTEIVDRVEPVLKLLGRPVRAGDVGAGHAVKALNNLMSATHLWVTSEAMVAGQRFGLDPEVMLSVFNGSSGRSGSTDNKWPNFILPGSYDSGFGLRLMLKDMKIATALARAVGVEPVLGDEAVELWSHAADDLAATADHTEVARWIASTALPPSDANTARTEGETA
ncbi:3-hydroxyisobutyrate dehydrogenase [Mycolicibacterium canariasense]|uniref:3-hydroxyisobutyrate dehydrogenase n=1 Tax=Mycolicibacterium canariasense TaxID=228230 RepID=A0A100WK06_MYCCR|nr:NAD(P)-dependent oxidoreductase [Mycolicibacterium canariasense]GAS99339.1 3-hydroxyisobutyrate dehydrogenase [Mycolicibacterium canariasense]